MGRVEVGDRTGESVQSGDHKGRLRYWRLGGGGGGRNTLEIARGGGGGSVESVKTGGGEYGNQKGGVSKIEILGGE